MLCKTAQTRLNLQNTEHEEDKRALLELNEPISTQRLLPPYSAGDGAEVGAAATAAEGAGVV